MARDPVDDWLNAQVEPLAPAQGSFERIRRRARRRKARRAAASAAGAAIVLAAAVTVPKIATSLQSQASRPSRPVAVGSPSVSAGPRPTGMGDGTPSSGPSSVAPPSTSRLSAAGSGQPVPPNFQPTSVTFVGPAIGAVIGQAGNPGHCATAYCTSLAGTSDYGSTWYGVSAPKTGEPDGSFGVGRVRFLNTSDGWAFGPQLWVTHDGGATWTQENTGGQRVIGLETAGNRAFAVLAKCTGSGPDYAAKCTAVSLYTSGASSDQWQPVSGPVSGLGPPAGQETPVSASLVLTGTQGYLLAPSGELLTGPLTGGAWTVASDQAPCLPGLPWPDGEPTGALLAANASGLVLVCTSATDTAANTQVKSIAESSNDGVTWSSHQPVTAQGIATSVATQGQGSLVALATDTGIYLSSGGSDWQLAQGSPGGAAADEGGFSYVGMTTPLDGVALPADPGLHEVFITTDGGSTWQPHAVSTP
jgi:hypothetical protein